MRLVSWTVSKYYITNMRVGKKYLWYTKRHEFFGFNSLTAASSHLSPFEAHTWFEVAWTGYDTGSGITGFDIQYKVDSGNWTSWLTDTMDTEAMFMADSRRIYTFRVTALDWVGNAGQDEASV